MKKLLLYGPLLWVRKIIVYVLIAAIVLGVVFYYVANSPFVINKVADTFAPDYNISYSRIHGNVLTGLEIEDLSYNKNPLAKHIRFKWNPNGLVNKNIIVNTLQIEKANVDNIKTLVTSLGSMDKNESDMNESNVSEPFSFGISVHHVSLDLEPFVQQGIRFSKVMLDVRNVEYTSDKVSVRALDLHIDSNISELHLQASLKKDTVQIQELTIKDVNALALQTLFITDSNGSNESDVAVHSEANSSKYAQENPLIPKWVLIDKVQISVLPLVYDPVKVNHFVFRGWDTVFDIQKLMLEKANLDLNASTNLSDIVSRTKVKNNLLKGQIRLTPTAELFELYELPLRKEVIGDIVIDVNASEDRVTAGLSKTMKQLLKAEKDGFNLDIESLKSTVVYDITKASIQAETKAILSTPYAKDITVSNLITMDDNISYSGEIRAKQIIGVDAKFVKPLNNLQVDYVGDTSSIHTGIKSDNIQGTFVSDDFKNAKLHLVTPEAIVLSDMVELPEELNQSRATLEIDLPISFEANATLVAEVEVRSNVINIDANISYKENLEVKSVSHIPEESLLRPYSKELIWDSLNPITVDTKLTDDGADIALNAGTLSANAHYVLDSTKVDGKIELGGLQANITGVAEEKITINTKINSMASLMESIQGIYTLTEAPMVKGSADLSVVITALKKVDLSLKSPEIIYQVDRKTEHKINDISFVVSMEDSKVQLTNYTLTYAEQKLFATKPSTVSFKDDIVSIDPLWINDELQVAGEYNVKAKKGTIDAQAKKLHISHEVIDLDNSIDIKTVLDGNKTSVNGTVILLGGKIHYDLGQKSYASDSDILIVQDMKEEEESVFMDNLSAAAQVKTQKPLIYNKGAINIQAMVDVTIHKTEYSDLMVLGSVEILEGGSYIFENKKFVFDKSYVYFTGNPNKPLLEASVKYKSVNHLITIRITGTPNTPNINFSSVPALSREEILSVILFDSEGGAGTNSSEDMMKMMGGAMAKSALSDLGVQLDHLVLGAGGSMEVGKKLTDNITVIYINDEIPSVKVKYKHGKRTESVLGASEESQSYDIIYKRDF